MKSIDVVILGAALCLAGAQAPSNGRAECPAGGQRDYLAVISSWPDTTKTAARALVDKYGPPDGVLSAALVWSPKKTWTSVALYRDPALDPDPLPHEDFVENKISYWVPESEIGALGQFDHALFVDQMRKIVAAHSDSEKNNILALNLVNEIVTGALDAVSARRLWKKTIEESLAGKSSPYTESLMFTPSEEPRVHQPPRPKK